ncbi:GMC family oxidoreductase [Pseudochelatococcus sp. B33]
MTDTSFNGRRLVPTHDIIICGSGSSGSVIARRLADNPDLKVLLIEAGGDDQRPSVLEAARWPENLGSETDWGFAAEASARVNGRSIPMSMGKVLGGGSSINVMAWARGHKRDWDYYAEVSGDPGWSYDSVLDIYRRIEDWRGAPDVRRGSGGILTVTQPTDPSPVVQAMIDAAVELGIPRFDSPNGEMMESKAGVAPLDLRMEGGLRLSVFGSYVRPILDRTNLTVLTSARVLRVMFEGRRATGVELIWNGEKHVLRASAQVVLSAGAINTPQLLMLSGVGDRAQLAAHGLDLIQHLPGVGNGLQDHTTFQVVSEHPSSILPRGNGSEAMLYAASSTAGAVPDILMCQAEFPICSPEAGRGGVPQHGWSMFAGLAQPRSRGRVRLRSADPLASPIIELNALSDPDDCRIAEEAVKLSRDIAKAEPFARLGSREIIPGKRAEQDLAAFIRDSAMPFWHQSCTARMGRDDDAVVGPNLKVYGLENLTVADASIMPRITTGNTMGPCVVIGERAAEILLAELG